MSQEEPTIYEELLAAINGQDLAVYRKEAAFRAELVAESDQYLHLPPNQWPKLEFNWDLSKVSQKFSLDGTSDEDFSKFHPQGFLLGWVNLPDFDTKLCHFSRRDGNEELWSLGSSSNLAFLIAYLSHGHPISPPLVKPLETGELILGGGHHRYAIAKVLGITELPIHINPEHKNEIDRIISANWIGT